jgi:hypothetical protein
LKTLEEQCMATTDEFCGLWWPLGRGGASGEYQVNFVAYVVVFLW